MGSHNECITSLWSNRIVLNHPQSERERREEAEAAAKAAREAAEAAAAAEAAQWRKAAGRLREETERHRQAAMEATAKVSEGLSE